MYKTLANLRRPIRTAAATCIDVCVFGLILYGAMVLVKDAPWPEGYSRFVAVVVPVLFGAFAWPFLVRLRLLSRFSPSIPEKGQDKADLIRAADANAASRPYHAGADRLAECGGGQAEISADALLERDKIELDLPEVSEAYEGRCVFVSGAGGSIGSELARQVVAAGARKVVLYDHSEYALYTIERELRQFADAHGVRLIPVLASVTDQKRAQAVLREQEVDIVLHAAAYKHVPMIEENEIAGVRNNVIGTQTMAVASRLAGVRRFMLVSTDKAVRPTNIMGATKRLAELVVQDMQTRSESTVFSMVRFGNVLGSSGSVIPLFREQIRTGGPITLTHADVTRYFMTIPEAARLVLLAGSFAEGGEVFVLDMGDPIRILDLARRMVSLSGLRLRDDDHPQGDIEVRFTGLRPGEKLFEELLIDARNLPTPHPKIMRAEEIKLSELEMARLLRDLTTAIDQNDKAAVRQIVQASVDGYHIQGKIAT